MKLKIILSVIMALVLTSVFAAAGTVTITPSSPYTSDTLTAKVSGSTATYNFYCQNTWFLTLRASLSLSRNLRALGCRLMRMIKKL